MASVLLIVLLGCKKDDPYPKIQLICNWSADHYSGESFSDISAEVVLSETGLSQGDSVYVLEINQRIGELGGSLLSPCNLPESAKVDGLRVTVSGHIVRTDYFNSVVHLYGYPCEVTEMK